MKYGSTRSSHYTRRRVIAGVLALALIAGGAWLWYASAQEAKDAAGQTAQSIEAEKESTEEFEKKLQEQKSNDSTGRTTSEASNLTVANVILGAATETEMRGYISNVLEEGGICTASYTKGSTVITGTSKGFVDVNKTTCPPISVTGLSRGDWTATLSYKSATASGKSEAVNLSVK